MRRRWNQGATCRECWQVGGILVPGDPRPPIIEGVAQRAAEALPERCPKCGVGPPAWHHQDGLYARCVVCGADAYLSSGQVITERQAVTEHRARLKARKGVGRGRRN